MRNELALTTQATQQVPSFADLGGTGGYIFNLSTKALTIGTYSLAVAAAGSPVGSITTQIR